MFPLQPSQDFEDAAGLGHPYVRAAVEAKVVGLRKEGRSMRAIARELVKGNFTVQRIVAAGRPISEHSVVRAVSGSAHALLPEQRPHSGRQSL